jgi:hypothetical protein
MKRFITIVLCAAVSLAVHHCSPSPVAGTKSGSETTNGYVAGLLIDGDSRPAADALVKLIPKNYDPVKADPASALQADTTDEAGAYSFIVADTTIVDYTIEAVQLVKRTRSLITGIAVNHDTTQVRTSTLQVPGTITVKIPAGMDTAGGYMYVPGSTIFASHAGSGGIFVLDSVPSGMIPEVYFAKKNDTLRKVIRYDIPVTSGDTVTIVLTAWSRALRVFLNTSASGAGVAENVYDFPVLVRLTRDNFDFSQAKPDGGDIRFAKSDSILLPYDIERWDAQNGNAEVWVKADTVLGNNSSQYILMYWGNPDAIAGSSSVTVFDTAKGFQGVWHMGQATGAVVLDATGNHFDATPSDTAPCMVPGTIGKAQEFDGFSSYLTMVGTAAGKLDFPERGKYMVSAWVTADTIKYGDNFQRQYIVQKGINQYTLQLNNTLNWDFGEYESANMWNFTTSPGTAHQWTYLAGVRAGDKMYLYVNGECADSTVDTNVAPDSRITDADLVVGKHAGASYTSYFDGTVDEVRIASFTAGPAWIRLCYMNQRADDKLIQMK